MNCLIYIFKLLKRACKSDTMPKNAFKVVMLGAQLCGKTSLIEQCVNGIYADGMVSFLIISFKKKF